MTIIIAVRMGDQSNKISCFEIQLTKDQLFLVHSLVTPGKYYSLFLSCHFEIKVGYYLQESCGLLYWKYILKLNNEETRAIYEICLLSRKFLKNALKLTSLRFRVMQ